MVRVFISYSWTNSVNEPQRDRVKKIADLLATLGFEVYWDDDSILPLGANLDAFMELVKDHEKIDKILVLSDAKYAEKANTFKGGVGQECELLRSEVYGNPYQNRIIPAFFDTAFKLPFFFRKTQSS